MLEFSSTVSSTLSPYLIQDHKLKTFRFDIYVNEIRTLTLTLNIHVNTEGT